MQYREGQKIAVIGFGVTGQSTANFLLSRGAGVSVFEGKEKGDFDVDVIKRIESKGGEVYFEQDFSKGVSGTEFNPVQYDFVVVSPGISPTSSLFQEIVSHNVEVCNDLTLFIEEWREIGPIIGITGSNGKSTVVSLLYESLKNQKNCILGGNIGNSPLDMLDVNYEKGTIAILEISSSQLEIFKEQHCMDICLLMNLSSNHLDRYNGQMSLYAEVKLKAVGNKTKLILCGDDPGTQKFVFPIVNKMKNNPVVVSLENNSNLPKNFNFEKCNLKGTHNLYNIAFVIEIMNSLNIPFDLYKEDLEKFKGLEDRIETVKEINGVLYVNDSKSTSPQAIEVALEALGKEKNITLIAGGDDKEMSFKNLEPLFEMYVKNLIILPGDINLKLKNISQSVNVYEVGNMEEAVKLASSLENLVYGDVVLLSPGSGSHSAYHGFHDRGNRFKEFVLGI